MEPKIVLVTGGNKGIGYEVAVQLAAKNFQVFVGARNEKAGREAAAEIGNDATFLKIDVADEKSIHAAATEFAKSAHHLDVLVNNAGVFSFAPFEQFSEQEFHRMFNTNVLGTFLMIDLLLQDNDPSFLRRQYRKLERGAFVRRDDDYGRLIERHFRVTNRERVRSHVWSLKHNPLHTELIVFECGK